MRSSWRGHGCPHRGGSQTLPPRWLPSLRGAASRVMRPGPGVAAGPACPPLLLGRELSRIESVGSVRDDVFDLLRRPGRMQPGAGEDVGERPGRRSALGATAGLRSRIAVSVCQRSRRTTARPGRDSGPGRSPAEPTRRPTNPLSNSSVQPSEVLRRTAELSCRAGGVAATALGQPPAGTRGIRWPGPAPDQAGICSPCRARCAAIGAGTGQAPASAAADSCIGAGSRSPWRSRVPILWTAGAPV